MHWPCQREGFVCVPFYDSFKREVERGDLKKKREVVPPSFERLLACFFFDFHFGPPYFCLFNKAKLVPNSNDASAELALRLLINLIKVGPGFRIVDRRALKASLSNIKDDFVRPDFCDVSLSEARMQDALMKQTDTNIQVELNLTSIRTTVSVPLEGVDVPTEIVSFYGLPDAGEHIAICFGNWRTQKNPLVRIHSECLTGDVFGSAKCDCGPQLKEAIQQISKENGVILYMRQEGRGIGLYKKLEAYVLQAQGLDTYQANLALGFKKDLRDYSPAACMLKALGIKQVRLLSNNPDKREQLASFGIQINEAVSTSTFENPLNRKYLQAKVTDTAHKLNIDFSKMEVVHDLA